MDTAALARNIVADRIVFILKILRVIRAIASLSFEVTRLRLHSVKLVIFAVAFTTIIREAFIILDVEDFTLPFTRRALVQHQHLLWVTVFVLRSDVVAVLILLCIKVLLMLTAPPHVNVWKVRLIVSRLMGVFISVKAMVMFIQCKLRIICHLSVKVMALVKMLLNRW